MIQLYPVLENGIKLVDDSGRTLPMSELPVNKVYRLELQTLPLRDPTEQARGRGECSVQHIRECHGVESLARVKHQRNEEI